MRAILICPDQELSTQFEQSAEGQLTFSKRPAGYPPSETLSRMVRTWAPEVVFMSLEKPETAAELCEHLDSEFPGLQRVGIARTADPKSFRLALRTHMRELFTPPFEAEEIERLRREILSHLMSHPAPIESSDRLYAFVPAKAGVGASTVAASVTRIFSSAQGTRSLLADFDLHSGISGFLFKADHDYGVADALQMARSLDDQSWQRLVKRCGGTDLLLSGAPRLEDQSHVKLLPPLIEFLRRSYGVISADLPDALNDVSVAVLREANHILLVTTPELTSLRLARQKVSLFKKMEIDGRLSLIVNRTTKRMDLTLQEIEQSVGAPVLASIPSDYAGVSEAIRDGRQPRGLHPHFEQLASALLKKNLQNKKRTSFIERLALVPLKYKFS